MKDRFIWLAFAIIGIIFPLIIWFMNDGGRGDALKWLAFVATIALVWRILKHFQK